MVNLLQKYPKLIELIISLLLKFRIYKIELPLDITKAFLQITMVQKDRDYLRVKNEYFAEMVIVDQRITLYIYSVDWSRGADRRKRY